MAYLLDSNVFIEAKNRYYGFDFCPGFWDWLDKAHEEGSVYSLEAVHDELVGYDDELSAWARQRQQFFRRLDAAVLPSLQTVATWVSSHNYPAGAVHLFLQGADFYLISEATTHNDTVVTLEVHSTSTKKVKIPDVCIGLGVKVMTPFAMLRAERVRLRL